MALSSAVYTVLNNYTACRESVQAIRLGSAGGFSGSELWRIRFQDQQYCLRRWPAGHPNRDRLTFIHQVLRRAASQGLDFVPAPLETVALSTFVEHESRFWELAPWLPGRADFHAQPTDDRLTAAMFALGRFHNAVADVSALPFPPHGPPPSFIDRKNLLFRLLDDGLETLSSAVRRRSITGPLDTYAHEALQLANRLAPHFSPKVAAAAELRLPLQPAIRDIWHDHVLFTDDRVTGLVDFGATRIDTPLTDIARLVGSLVGDDAKRRELAFEAYAFHRPLTAEDRRLIDLLDHSGVLLGALNWIQWLYLESRRFEDLTAVATRLATLLSRLKRYHSA